MRINRIILPPLFHNRLTRKRKRLLEFEWKERMKADNYYIPEAVVFLLLGFVLRLPIGFDKDELEQSVATVAPHECDSALCSRLGFKDKMVKKIKMLTRQFLCDHLP